MVLSQMPKQMQAAQVTEFKKIVGSGGGLGHVGVQFAKAVGIKVMGIDVRSAGLKVTRMRRDEDARHTVIEIAQPDNVVIPLFRELIFRDIRVRGLLIASPNEARDRDMLERLWQSTGLKVKTNIFQGLGEFGKTFWTCKRCSM
ncbi:hypothetical protein ACEQ8H_004878 [Pleosporales sp. CAS-2024a]